MGWRERWSVPSCLGRSTGAEQRCRGELPARVSLSAADYGLVGLGTGSLTVPS